MQFIRVNFIQVFLSTPSARRATMDRLQIFHGRGISIHALREEGDSASRRRYEKSRLISIHALREEGDLRREYNNGISEEFLSTPSARRATHRPR